MLQGWQDLDAFAGTNWTTPANAGASDDSYAQYNNTGQDWLKCTDADLAIPYNAIIRGIEVRVEAKGSGETIAINLTKDGSTPAATEKTQLLTASDAVYTFGGPTDLWSAGWDIDELNAATFGVLVADDDASAGAIDIDHVSVRVYYDVGVRGFFHLDFDGFAELTNVPVFLYVDGHLDYDGGSGGTTPAVGDCIWDATSKSVARVIVVDDAQTSVFGCLALADLHHGDGGESVPAATPFADNDGLAVLDYVDFDTETGNGVSESDIGLALTGGTLSGAVVRHVVSNGEIGRIWFTKSSGALADTNSISIDGSAVATANGASVANAWTGSANGTMIAPTQGYFNYDTETAAFAASPTLARLRGKALTSSAFQHNVCICGDTSNETAMIVDKMPDAITPTAGRLFVADVSGTFTAGEDIFALEEVSCDAEQNGGVSVGDTVSDSGVTHSWVVRRMINNGDGTAVLYLERATGTARFADNDAIYSSATQRYLANGAQRQRVGAASIVTGEQLQAATVQWMSSHLYSDLMDLWDDEDGAQDNDRVPMTSQVQDQQYTLTNFWVGSHFSMRRLKKGSMRQFATLGGLNQDTVYTNYYSVSSQADDLASNTPEFFVEQGSNSILAQFWDDGPIDVLVRNKEDDALIESGAVTWFVREWGTLYGRWPTSAVGGAAVVSIETKDDVNNQTALATVENDGTINRIRLSFASHLLDFTGGAGTLEECDVILNSTRSEAVMVVRVPDSLASGSDLHVAADGQALSAWVSTDSLDLLDRIDFDAVQTDADGNPLVFAIGDSIDNGGAKSGTVRFVRQYGSKRGTIWIQTSDTWSDGEDIEVGTTKYAEADGAQVTANTWAATLNGAPSSDNTVLRDIGQGGDQPYNWVACGEHCASAPTTAEYYEFFKLVTYKLAGRPGHPGSVLYPNNTAKYGCSYLLADSAYTAVDIFASSPLSTKAGDDLTLARGGFISVIDADNVQNWATTDANGTPRTPPNYQSAVLQNVLAGDLYSVLRRAFEAQTDFVFTADDGNGDSTIATTAGDFVAAGIMANHNVAITGGANDGNSGWVRSVTANLITMVGTVFSTETLGTSQTVTSDKENRRRYTGHATNNSQGDGTFDVTASITSDEPDSGKLVVTHKDGTMIYEDIYTVTSWSGTSFTVTPNLVRDYDSNAIAYMPVMQDTASTSGTKS